jgi:ABC-type nitrate/sulfonate/bicarbonate transport system substrate-binding protein
MRVQGRTWLSGIAVIAAVPLLLSGCAQPGQSPEPKAESTTVRLVQGGSNEDVGNAYVFKAIELLKAEGINVTLDNVSDPAMALRAVVAGQSDIFLGAPVEAARAVANGDANVRFIASTIQTSNYVVLARPDLTLENLEGATFATAGPSTAGDIIGMAALKELGVDTTKLNRVTVGGTSARVTAILSGQVDLAPVLAPSAVSAVETGKVKILVNAGQALGLYIQKGLIANGDFISNNPNLTQSVVAAFIDAARFSTQDSDGYLKLVAANALDGGLNADEQLTVWNELVAGNFFAVNGALCTEAIDKTMDLESQGEEGLPASERPNDDDWIDATFVRAYLSDKGQSPDEC